MTLTGVALVVVTFFAALAWGPGDEQVSVFVALGDIPARRLVTDDMVAREVVSAEAVPPGAVRDLDQVVGRYTTEAVFDGEAFTTSRLAAETSGTADVLSADLPANTRVLSVPTDVSAALAGRIQAGDVVDVVAVMNRDGGGGGVATTLVQQALVLDTAPAEAALRASARESPGGATATDTSTSYVPGIYSLALSPQQVHLVALAASGGELYLSLNPVGGARPFEPGITTYDSLTQSAGELAPLATPPASAPAGPAPGSGPAAGPVEGSPDDPLGSGESDESVETGGGSGEELPGGGADG